MSKLIPLTQGQHAIVDDADYDWLSQWSWCLVSGKYAGHSVPNPNGARPRQVFIWMHKFIVGATSNERVDHKNGNKLDNQRHNLRHCTNAQNTHNRPKLTRGAYARIPTSQYKGVHWRAARNRWEVLVYVDRQAIYIGRYTDELEAAHAYDAAARIYHGEFARTNF